MAAEIKKSKLVSAKFNKQYEGASGTVYYFDLAFEDGTVGSYGSKSNPQTKFTVGQETEYELSLNDKGYKLIRPVQKQGGFGGTVRKNEKAENARCALTNAVSLANHGVITYEEVKEKTKTFMAWLETQSN